MKEKDSYYQSPEDRTSIELPSQKESKKKPAKKKKSLKWIVIISIIVLLYFFYTPISLWFQAFLEQNPTLHSYYLYVQGQITNLTLTGLFFFSIMGSLFFLVIPSEATFIYYLTNTDHTIFWIILIGVGGNVIGMLFNYGFGRLLGQKVLKFFFGVKEFYTYKDKIDKYGGYLLLIGNIIPGPIEFISVFYGGFKYSFPKYFYLVMMGRLIKYLLLLIAFLYFWDSILFYYEGIIIFFENLFNF